MKYLLDTNICIFLFRNQKDIADKITSVGFKNCAISEISKAELLYGAYSSENLVKHLGQVNSFIEAITVIPISSGISIFAQEKARLRKLGNQVADFDLLIGASAIANNLELVTDNVKDFERISNLSIENWVKR